MAPLVTVHPMSDTEGADPFAAAVRRRLDDMGRTQSWLGAEIARLLDRGDPFSQAAISNYLMGKVTPEPAVTFANEQALQVRAGSLSRLLGYLPAGTRSARSVPDAIADDPGLGDTARLALLAAYQQLVDHRTDGG